MFDLFPQLQDAQQDPICTQDFCENPPGYPGVKIATLLEKTKLLPGQFENRPGPRTQGRR